MRRHLALALSTAVAAVTLLATIGLAILVTHTAPAEPVADVVAADPSGFGLEALQQEYAAQLQTSNDALVGSYDRIAELQGIVAQLKAQNATLLEREAVYQQRLDDANARLQANGAVAEADAGD